jgi:hypothetical protein
LRGLVLVGRTKYHGPMEDAGVTHEIRGSIPTG